MISRTALMAAAARAAHLLVDSPPYLLDDPVATRMLGARAGELLDYHRLHGTHLVLSAARAQVTTRTRVTESRLRASGADQYVLLGAGLDSFAHRSPVRCAFSRSTTRSRRNTRNPLPRRVR
ncbi:MAG TPA: class I SAM-dependent methyltransferase [Actinophytocola sp.]|nr:class I SAM-dependent methyltransferase [Actinophytocola sp.]